jgi:hypothetical protein
VVTLPHRRCGHKSESYEGADRTDCPFGGGPGHVGPNVSGVPNDISYFVAAWTSATATLRAIALPEDAERIRSPDGATGQIPSIATRRLTAASP